MGALAACLLTVSVIIGANLSVQASMQELLDIALSQSPVDMVIQQDPGTSSGITDIQGRLTGIEGVQQVVTSSVAMVRCSPSGNSTYERSVSGQVVGLGAGMPARTLPPRLLDVLHIRFGTAEGAEGIGPMARILALGPYEAVLLNSSVEMLRETGLDVTAGDEVTFEFSHAGSNRTFRCSLHVAGIATTTKPEPLEAEEPVLRIRKPLMLTNLWTEMRICEELGLDPTENEYPPLLRTRVGMAPCLPSSGVFHMVFLDRARLAQSRNLFVTLHNIGLMKDRITVRMTGEIAEVRSLVDSSASHYRQEIEAARPVLIMGSLAAICLGVYLAFVSIDIVLTNRRREIALLKSRGMSNKSSTKMFFAESALIGGLGGVAGLCLAFSLIWFSDILLHGPAPVNHYVGGLPGLLAAAFSTQSISFAILVGAGVMVAASARPIQKIGRLGLVNALGGYSSSLSEQDYRGARLDLLIILVPLGIYSALALTKAAEAWSFSLVGILLSALSSIGALMLPFTPILLILGSARILTRGTSKPLTGATALISPVMGDMGLLVRRSLGTHSHRSSQMVVLTGLSLALGTFLLIFQATQIQREKSMIAFNVGGDLRIGPLTNPPPSLTEDLSYVSAVASTAIIRLVRPQQTTTHIWVVGIDPESYLGSIVDNPHLNRRLVESLSTLSDKEGEALLQEKIMEAYNWSIGSTIKTALFEAPHQAHEGIAKPSSSLKLVFRVGGAFPYLPGLADTARVGSGLPTVLVTRRDELESQPTGALNRTEIVLLLHLKPDADPKKLLEDLRSRYPSLFEGGYYGTIPVEARKYEEKKMRRNPSRRSLMSFTMLAVGFTVVVATLGNGIILLDTGATKTSEVGEIGGQLARGISPKQVTSLLMGEATSIALVSCLIGIPVGLFTAATYQSAMAHESNLLVHTGQAYPWTLLLLPSLFALSVAGTSAAAARRIMRTEFHEMLRIVH